MKKFLVFYSTPKEAMAQTANSTPEEQAKGMEAWMKWKNEAGHHVLDFGAPLMPGQQVDSSKNWSSIQNGISGYSILQANSLEDLKPLFATHPHLNSIPGCSISVTECIDM